VTYLKSKVDTKQKKKKSNKLLILIVILCLAVISIAGVFYGTYYYMMNQSVSSYEKTIKTKITDIGQTNKKTSLLMKGASIDTELVKKDLPQYINKLTDIRDSLKDLTPSNTHKQSQIYIEEGLQNNILLYRQIHSIVQNPNSKDISSTLNDLKNYNDEMINNYTLYQNRSFDILLPKEARDFIAKSSNYVNELVKIQKETDVKVRYIMDFAEKLDSVINKFIPIKTDFGTSLQKVRAGSGNFDDVLIQIDDAKAKFNNLKGDFSSSKPPKDSKESNTIYNSFGKILEDYSLFLNELRFAVSTEKAKAKGKPLSNEELKNIYLTSNTKFGELSTKYDNFLKAYSEFKSNNIK
jgi:hypothetical protein